MGVYEPGQYGRAVRIQELINLPVILLLDGFSLADSQNLFSANQYSVRCRIVGCKSQNIGRMNQKCGH